MNRKMKAILALCVALALTLCSTFALADAAAPTATFQPGDIVDALGRKVTLDKQPEKIVSLSPSNTEILFALGVGDKVIGVDSYSDYPEEAKNVANKVGDYSGPNVELILSLQPDIVFADDTLQQDAIDQLEKLGAKVVAVNGKTYDSVADSIKLVAQCVGADPTKVLADMDATKQEALAMVKADAKQKVYFALSFGQSGDWTSGTGTFVDDMLNMLGATNVGADLGAGWMSISLEKLLAADPDVILIPGDQTMVDSFKADANYSKLSAVKNNAVYAVDQAMSQRPGPRLAQALKQFAEILYPADAQAKAA